MLSTDGLLKQLISLLEAWNGALGNSVGEKPKTIDENGALTFLTYFSFVSRHTDADSHDAGAMTKARWVNALFFWNIALWPLPAISADTVSFLVFSIPTTQHRA